MNIRSIVIWIYDINLQNLYKMCGINKRYKIYHKLNGDNKTFKVKRHFWKNKFYHKFVPKIKLFVLKTTKWPKMFNLRFKPMLKPVEICGILVSAWKKRENELISGSFSDVTTFRRVTKTRTTFTGLSNGGISNGRKVYVSCFQLEVS